MTRSIQKRSVRHLSYLLPILMATGCSQIGQKDHFADDSTGSKFSVLTRKSTNNIDKNHASVWDRMLSLYALPEADNARIDREINWYLRNPEYLTRVQQRAEPYMYFILNEIEAKKLPGEMALLPIVESAFRADAMSPAQASGLWQFIPPTGRLYGLKQNSWYDGRRDVIESTQAATSFLKELSENFNNDWLLALASYNAGKGNIRNAIDRNNYRGLPTDFWSLDLNHETSAYVPRLLAIAKIFANPEKYNINMHHVPNEPYFELVDIKSQLDLGKAAEMAQTPVDDLFKLNPGFNRWSTDPTGPHRLLIPKDKADTFKEKLADLPHHDRIKWLHHTAAHRENLKTIAKRYNTSQDEIKQINHLENDAVAEGKTLLIPISFQPLKGEAVASNSATTGTVSAVSSVKSPYIVKKGDTLSKIADQYNLDQGDLLSWNKLKKTTDLKPGQKLLIKKGGDLTVASNAPVFKQISYTVKNGESLPEIAKHFSVNVSDLKKWNAISKKQNALKAGSKLKITVETSQTSS